MKLFRLRQEWNQGEFDFYTMIVSAETEEDAKNMHPLHPEVIHFEDKYNDDWMKGSHVYRGDDWVRRSELHLLHVEYLGETTAEKGVLMTSLRGRDDWS